MKLTNQKFIKLLSDHLAGDEREIGDQLQKMVSDLNKSIGSGESFSIDGLGSFTLEAGVVKFAPSIDFATEVNHAYEGMQPVDVAVAAIVDPDETAAKPGKSKKAVKKDIIIIDDEVAGEEDPFGIDSDDPSILETEKADALSDNRLEKESEPAEAEESSGTIGVPVSSEEEPGLTEDEKETEHPVEMKESVEETGDAADSGQPEDTGPDEDIPAAEDLEMVETDLVLEEAETPDSGKEGADEPKDFIETNTEKTAEVQNPEDEPVGSTVEEEQNEGSFSKNQPRIVKLSEHEEKESRLPAILKISGIAAVILFTFGLGWWYYTQYNNGNVRPALTGPVVTTDTSSRIDEDAFELNADQDLFQSGVSVPLGSVDDDPEPDSQADEQDTRPGTQSADIDVDQPADSLPTTVTNTLPTAVQTANTETYGLGGVPQTISGPVFSIIVHSLPTENAANSECDEIASMGLRCIVREATGPQGRRTFRVGIGQFPSMGAAQAEAATLTEPFRSRNFIARVN